MSNKTPNEQHEETESELKLPTRNKKKLLFPIFLLIIGIFIVYSGITSLFDDTLRLIAPNGNIVVEVADTDALRARGLSGHEPLKDSEGMLFVFDQESTTNCFWMKDMTFSIDMVWLDQDKHVVTVSPDVSPETYPTTFCPDLPAKYGLELASGRAETLKIVPDAKLRW